MATEKKQNAYQLFINSKVVELKLMDEHKDKKYMEIRKVANEEWRKINPVDPSKPQRKPRVKKDATDDEKKPRAVKGAKAAEKAERLAKRAEKEAKKAARPVRPPSAYIQFISKTLPEIKLANPTVPQKELMSMAAAKWREHKEKQT
jgi:phage protein D